MTDYCYVIRRYSDGKYLTGKCGWSKHLHKAYVYNTEEAAWGSCLGTNIDEEPVRVKLTQVIELCK